jgi:hypothetical protein
LKCISFYSGGRESREFRDLRRPRFVTKTVTALKQKVAELCSPATLDVFVHLVLGGKPWSESIARFHAPK